MTAHTFEVLDVEYTGSVAVLRVRDARGLEGAVAAEPRMARDIDAALAQGERPTVTVESWQILPGWPGRPDREEVGAFG